MASGQILMFKADKGYGFIRPDDGSSNVYVHVSALTDAGIAGVIEGQKLSYDLKTENDKISAINLRLAE